MPFVLVWVILEYVNIRKEDIFKWIIEFDEILPIVYVIGHLFSNYYFMIKVKLFLLLQILCLLSPVTYVKNLSVWFFAKAFNIDL